jgi:hypothetical protein
VTPGDVERPSDSRVLLWRVLNAALAERHEVGRTDTNMPGCVLRVQSKTSNVEILVKASGLRPVVIHRKGHPRVPGATVLSARSGFNVDVSRADGVVEKQSRDAIRFLRRHAAGLGRLRRCQSFGAMSLDFGLYDRATELMPWPSYCLPAALIELAGKHGISIELSFYGSGSHDGG